MKIQGTLENEKRDQAAERKETEQKMGLLKMKMQAAFENEKRERNAVRLWQLEQQLDIQPRYTHPILTTSPAQQISHPSLTQQIIHPSLTQHPLETKLQKSEHNQPQLPSQVRTPQTALLQGSASRSAARPSARPQGAMSGLKRSTMGKAKSLQSTPQPDAVTSLVTCSSPLQDNNIGSTASLPTAVKPPVAGRLKQDHHQSVAAQPSSRPPSKTVQPQHQITAAAPLKGGSAPLPGDALTHLLLPLTLPSYGWRSNQRHLS
jgi:hypothetical protein